MNIIPFDGKATLPAHLRTIDVSAVNADLLSHSGGGFPFLSIKGKQFTVVRDGERVLLRNPKDPDSPATSLDVVMLKVNPRVSKVFYIQGYNPDSADKPDCYSPDGTVPMADSKKPQSKTCATCPNNVWGSKITESGKKGKACQDSVRVAVAPAGQINDPMLLRVPPASIRALGEYGQDLAKRGVVYNAVVTKIGFDPMAESPKLTFKPVGFLDEGGYRQATEMQADEKVKQIIQGLSAAAEVGGAPVAPLPPMQANIAQARGAVNTAAAAAKPAKTVTEDDVAEAVEAAAPAPAKAATPKAKPPAPAMVDGDLDVDLGGITFDD